MKSAATPPELASWLIHACRECLADISFGAQPTTASQELGKKCILFSYARSTHDRQKTQALAEHSNMEKDPADWVTGDEPMTGAQRSYLKTLSEEANEPFDESLSKAQASRRIDELQARTGRGSGNA